jgi:TetR/AcrR family transcriptional regulator, ethionamide resistance regulator
MLQYVLHSVNFPMTPTATERTTRARRSREESRAALLEAIRELVRERSYPELSVGEVADRAGIGRTLFYRYYDDLGDLLRHAGREPIEELLAAQTALHTDTGAPAESIRAAVANAVAVYSRHGAVLRAAAEGAVSDELIAEGHRRWRALFDELVANVLRGLPHAGEYFSDLDETAHAINLLSASYLLDAFGNEPRVSEEQAIKTLTEIWLALIRAAEGD